MYKVMAVLAAIAIAGFSMGNAYPQEPQIAAFRETAQVVVDRTISGNITSSVTLQTTSNQEIKIPGKLNRAILDNPRIASVILTNQEGCGVLGVSDQSCILVNVVRAPEDTNIILIQNAAKESGDAVIDGLNELFDTDAGYHSSYLHHRDEINKMLGTSGAVSGRDIVSAIYTMSREETQSMYQKISSLTVAKEIREAGGFYDTAYSLASYDRSHMTLSIIPTEGGLLYQIGVSAAYPGAASTDHLSPLDYLQVDEIKRSRYFASGFYPLNSILQVVILSPQQVSIRDVNTNIIPTMEVDGEAIPTELAQNGWVFDSQTGTKIEGKYLFGTRTSASSNELTLELGTAGDPTKTPSGPKDGPVTLDESTAIIAIIAVFAAAAAGFYLKGYRKGPAP